MFSWSMIAVLEKGPSRFREMVQLFDRKKWNKVNCLFPKGTGKRSFSGGKALSKSGCKERYHSLRWSLTFRFCFTRSWRRAWSSSGLCRSLLQQLRLITNSRRESVSLIWQKSMGMSCLFNQNLLTLFICAPFGDQVLKDYCENIRKSLTEQVLRG